MGKTRINVTVAEEDSILLKIHRQYSQDEAVQYCMQVIKQLRMDKGAMQSEIDEMKHVHEQEVLKLRKELNIDIRPLQKTIATLNKKIQHMHSEVWMTEQNKKIADQIDHWKQKYESSRDDVRRLISELAKYKKR